MKSKVHPSDLLSVQDQTNIVSKHNTEIVNYLQIVEYTFDGEILISGIVFVVKSFSRLALHT